jgi:acetoin utilization protein AcuB
MKINAVMIPKPITITRDNSISDAIELMKDNSIRHLPVVTKNKTLDGFVTLSDLKQGLIPSMVSDLSLSDLMIKNPITIAPDNDIEVAAQIIYKHKISGIPVVENNRLVGIITETDILREFIHMMGILTSSSRLDVEVGEKKDQLKQILQVIDENGAEVINVGMTSMASKNRTYVFRLTSCDTGTIKNELEKNGFKVLEAMD